MEVQLIACTELSAFWYSEQRPREWNPEYSRSNGELLIEFAGRNCYQSFANPGKKTNAEYIANIIEHGHGSVLEHASCTFFITGISRSCSHEIVRHRHLSFSELSQRFVDMKTASFHCPDNADWESWGFFIDEVQKEYEEIQTDLGGMNLTRKQINEQARAVLPNATCTSIVVSGNLRAWRSFIDARANEHADAEICALAVEICTQLKDRFPNVFQDYTITGGYAYTHNRKV